MMKKCTQDNHTDCVMHTERQPNHSLSYSWHGMQAQMEVQGKEKNDMFDVKAADEAKICLGKES